MNSNNKQPRDSDEWIFTHLLSKKTLVFFGFMFGISVGWGAAILFAPNEAVAKASAKAQIVEQSRATANPTQPESNVRFQTAARDTPETRARRLAYPPESIMGNPVRAIEFLGAIADWGKEDLDGAIQWLQSANLGDQTGTFMGMAILGLSETEPARALDKGLKIYREDGPFPINPGCLLNICLQKLPERMEEVLNLPSRSDDINKTDMEFGPTTDFKKIGDLVLQKYRESGDEGWMPPAFPLNFISEFTKRYPQAAYDFCVAQNGIENKTVTANAVTDFITTYATTAAPSDAVEMLHYLMTTKEIEVSRLKVVEHFTKANEEQFGIFKQAMESVPVELRDAIGAETLEDYANSTDLKARTGRARALGFFVTPTARLVAIGKLLNTNPKLADEIRGHMTALGLDVRAVDAMSFDP